MQPVGEECLFGTLAHSRDGEMVFFSRYKLDSVIVDGTDLVERDLEAFLRIVGAVEYQAGGT